MEPDINKEAFEKEDGQLRKRNQDVHRNDRMIERKFEQLQGRRKAEMSIGGQEKRGSVA